MDFRPLITVSLFSLKWCCVVVPVKIAEVILREHCSGELSSHACLKNIAWVGPLMHTVLGILRVLPQALSPHQRQKQVVLPKTCVTKSGLAFAFTLSNREEMFTQLIPKHGLIFSSGAFLKGFFRRLSFGDFREGG